MPDKAWKKRERDVANYFNGKRTPLSGGSSKVTRADVIHDKLFVECKDLRAFSQLDLLTNWFQSGIKLPKGQP